MAFFVPPFVMVTVLVTLMFPPALLSILVPISALWFREKLERHGLVRMSLTVANLAIASGIFWIIIAQLSTGKFWPTLKC